MTACSSEQVLRKAKSETNIQLHTDPFAELVICRRIYDEEEPYIQELSMDPFMIVMYTEDSLCAARNYVKKGSSTFYIDATGSMIQRYQKRVLYYCIVIHNTAISSVPVLEFVLDHHATQYIMRPLFAFTFALVKKNRLTRVEVDFSWAIIHSVFLTFNYIHGYRVLFGIIFSGRARSKRPQLYVGSCMLCTCY